MRGVGIVGDHCYQTCKRCGKHSLCEHNQADASLNPNFICTGIGFKGTCDSGQKFSCVADKSICDPRLTHPNSKEA